MTLGDLLLADDSHEKGLLQRLSKEQEGHCRGCDETSHQDVARKQCAEGGVAGRAAKDGGAGLGLQAATPHIYSRGQLAGGHHGGYQRNSNP